METIKKQMNAMVLETPQKPLRLKQMPVPKPNAGQILIEVRACGVCRTDLHIVDGELTKPKLPLIPGHEIVGTVVQTGKSVEGFRPGDRVGVPWLGYTDQSCRYCQRDQENLCDNALFTGYTVDGGYAEYTVAHHRYCFHLPDINVYDDTEVAPLLCAGLIGYRSYRMAGDSAERIGFYGFGAAAHLLIQLAVHQGKKIYSFTKLGDTAGQVFARRLGSVWAGPSTEMPPEKLDAAIIFAPVGPLVTAALRATAKGGVVVCGGIHMSDIPSFPYEILWEERVIRSVANLTRQDAIEYFEAAPKAPVRAETTVYPLEKANEALDGIREGTLEGAAVLKIHS